MAEQAQAALQWLQNYWESTKTFEFKYGETPLSTWEVPVGACVAYLLAIFVGQKLMKGLPIIKATAFTYVHNMFLCLWSIAMVAGALYESYLLYVRNDHSLEVILCDSKGQTFNGRLNWWTWVFYLSKYYELIDTMLQIMRKRDLIFLHVYHHVITLLLVWVALCQRFPLQWMAIVTNGGVHIFMYYYYAQSSIGIRIWWKKYLTQLQIIQFVGDLLIPQLYVYLQYVKGGNCTGNTQTLVFGETVILSFLVLFIDFFRKTYLSEKKPSRKPAAAASAEPGAASSTSTTPVKATSPAKRTKKDE